MNYIYVIIFGYNLVTKQSQLNTIKAQKIWVIEFSLPGIYKKIKRFYSLKPT